MYESGQERTTARHADMGNENKNGPAAAIPWRYWPRSRSSVAGRGCAWEEARFDFGVQGGPTDLVTGTLLTCWAWSDLDLTWTWLGLVVYYEGTGEVSVDLTGKCWVGFGWRVSGSRVGVAESGHRIGLHSTIMQSLVNITAG